MVGVSRSAAAEFSFFLAVPVMIGASGYKLLKYILNVGFVFSTTELIVLLVGTVTAFAVSLIVIKFLMNFVRKHSFESFGWYRIALGVVVLGYNLIKILA
jgi:undecaprenyl-diphosphatase